MKPFLIVGLIMLGVISSCAHSGSADRHSDGRLNLTMAIFSIYEDGLNHLSGVKSGECPMYPSCSQYSKGCIQKYGFIVGWMMTCDRLMRCGRDDIKWVPRIYVNGKWKYHDPIEMNTLYTR